MTFADAERAYVEANPYVAAVVDQYVDHTLEERPLVRIVPGHVRSWGLE